MRETDIEFAVDELEASLREAMREFCLAQWRAELRGDWGPRTWPPQVADPRLRQTLARFASSLTTPSLGRRVEMLWRLVTEALLFSDRATIDAAGDGDLPRMWAALNRAARNLGCRGFYQLRLALDELDSTAVEVALGELDAATAAAWWGTAPRSRRGSAEPELGPDPGAVARGWLAAWGQAAAAIRFDVSAVPGPLSARFFRVDAPADVRIVYRSGSARRGRRALWHELGHALYAVHHRRDLPWSLTRPPSRCMDEGLAEVVADLGVAAQLPGESGDGQEGAAKSDWARLRWVRWQLVRASFERDAGANPGGDLDRRWRELVRRYLGEVKGRRRGWADVAHYFADPGSQASYLLAETIRRKVGALVIKRDGAAARAVLIDLFAAGAAHHWSRLLQGVTRERRKTIRRARR